MTRVSPSKEAKSLEFSRAETVSILLIEWGELIMLNPGETKEGRDGFSALPKAECPGKQTVRVYTASL